MTTLGISLIVIGITLVCVGTLFWRRASRIVSAGTDGPHEFRAIIDALDEEDRRSPDAGSAEPSVRPSIDEASTRHSITAIAITKKANHTTEMANSQSSH
jgi:hypothetical protein